jgi:hypothetical protein
MTPTMRTTSIRLQAGQSHWMQAKAGSQLFARAGTISIAPVPLGAEAGVVATPVRLREHELYVVDASGWITIKAIGPADIICQQHRPGVAVACKIRALGAAVLASIGLGRAVGS